MQVKGTLLMDYVRMIRSVKDKDWSKWLTDEDQEIINSKILPSKWYPYETMQRIGLAIFKELANSDLKMVQTFGKYMAGNLSQVYRNVIVDGDPIASVEKITDIQQMLFKDTEQAGRIIERGEKSFTMLVPVDLKVTTPEAAEAVGHQTAGVIEGIIENTGGKNVKTEINRKEGNFILKFQWE